MLDASLARDDLRPNKTVCLSHIFDKLMFEVTLFFYKKIKKGHCNELKANLNQSVPGCRIPLSLSDYAFEPIAAEDPRHGFYATDFRIDLSNLGDAALRLKKERQIRCRRQSSLWATGCSVLN
jgi:hypothetical protein